MKRLLGLIVIGCALLAASELLAEPQDWTLVRTETSAPTDADPNVTPPTLTFTVPEDCPLDRRVGRAYACLGYIMTIGGAFTTCDVQPYVENPGTGKWAAGQAQTGVTPYEAWIDPVIPNTKIFWRLTNCTGTISGGSPLTVYARGL